MVSHLAVLFPSFKLKELPVQILLLPKAQNYLFMGIICLIKKNQQQKPVYYRIENSCSLFEGKKTKPECSSFADFKHYKLRHRLIWLDAGSTIYNASS